LREPLLSAILILAEDGTILETSGDASLFLAAGEREARGKQLSQVGPELQRVLGGLLRRAARGRAVENYAFPFKVGRRLMPMRASAAPYPLAGTGKTGVLLNLRSREEREAPAPPARVARPRTLPIPGLLDDVEAAIPDEQEALADPVCLLDAEGHILRANAAFCRILGAEGEDELRGQRLAGRLEREEDVVNLLQALETARLAPWRGEFILRTGEGKRSVLSVTITLLRGIRGIERGFLVVGRDHTDRFRRWEEMEREASGLRRALEEAPYALICGRGESIVCANREAALLLGVPRERLEGMGLRDALGEEGADTLRGLLGGKEGGRPAEGETFTRRGQRGAEKTLRIRVRQMEPTAYGIDYVAGLEDLSDALELEGRVEGAERASRFLEGLSRAFSAPEEDEAVRECLEAFMELTAAGAGAFYRLEGEDLVPLCWRGFERDLAMGVDAWRVRPNRLPAGGWTWLEPPAGEGIRREEAPTPAYLRELDDFLAAHRREAGDRVLILLPSWRGRVKGLLALAVGVGRGLPYGAEDVLGPGLTLAGYLLAATAGTAEEAEKAETEGSAVEPGHLSPQAAGAAGSARGRGFSTAPETETVDLLRHRLSTSLTSVRGFAQLFEEGDMGEDEWREAAKGLREAVDRLIGEIGAAVTKIRPRQEGKGGEPGL